MRRRILLAGLAVALSGCIDRPSADASGEEIFLQLCSNCHGEQLQGGVGPSLGPGSNAADQPDEFLRVTITRGRGRMPSFESSLSDEQVGSLIEYIRQEQTQ